MTADRPRTPAKSGWCLTLLAPGKYDCGHCSWPGCACDCGHPNRVAAQADSTRIGYTGLGKDERPPAVTEDRSSHSDSLPRREGVGS